MRKTFDIVLGTAFRGTTVRKGRVECSTGLSWWLDKRINRTYVTRSLL